MFASRGLGNVNSNTIARAAGVGVGTFYSHFEDKVALHRERVSAGLSALQANLARASQAARDESVDAQVRATVEAFVDFAEAAPFLYRVVFASGEAAAARGRPAFGFSARAMENRLSELRAAGHLDPGLDIAAAARFFNAGQSQLLLWWLDAPEALGREQLIATLERLHPARACRR